ncbi:hypothetical protein [Zhihengliuella sp.]|uniref:hypothetical protein n=1 Tax=Zhihengliuella sp. TaxID=1954483 RepID=UPI002810D3AE|nr:hypothetical protein [Zhihengliuella sp.]
MEAAVERHDTSVRQLSFMAKKQGFRVVDTTLNQIRSGSYKSTPSHETIRAVAWLAGVSDEVAFTAAGQPVPGPPLGEELPPGSDYLSPKSRKAVVDMVRVLVELEGHGNAGSTNTAAQESTGEGEQPAGGGDAGEGQKTAAPAAWPADQFDLAAHPPMELERERFEREHGGAGEESQIGPDPD